MMNKEQEYLTYASIAKHCAKIIVNLRALIILMSKLGLTGYSSYFDAVLAELIITEHIFSRAAQDRFNKKDE